MITMATVLMMITTMMMTRYSRKILQHKRQVHKTKRDCLIVQKLKKEIKKAACCWTHLNPQHCFQRPA